MYKLVINMYKLGKPAFPGSITFSMKVNTRSDLQINKQTDKLRFMYLYIYRRFRYD